MRSMLLVFVPAAAAILGGCSKGTPSNVMPVGFMGPVWNATLTAPSQGENSRISGFAMMIGNASHSQTRVQLDLRHAQAGSELPWHLHRGACGNDQGIVGDPAKYGALVVAADGEAGSVAIIDVPLPDSGQFMVNVHASATNMDSVVACGNMTGPSS